MLLPTIVLLAFTLWTLCHWQSLPELLKDETADEHWPLSIHHTATPMRLLLVSLLYSLFACALLWLLSRLLGLFLSPVTAGWLATALLIAAHFIPGLANVCAYVRYLFQRHLFFPSLPSHQEDTIIRTLMRQAPNGLSLPHEITHLHQLLRKEFKAPIHALNLVGIRAEYKLVKREFKKLRRKGLVDSVSLDNEELQQMRFHLYSCYRLLARVTLSRFWSGRDRRWAFRRLGYTINTGDDEIYSRCRRLRYLINHLRHHHHPAAKNARRS